MTNTTGIHGFWVVAPEKINGRQRLRGRKIQAKRRALLFDVCETRQLLTLPATLTIPLVPELDQFGDQILVVQGYGVPDRAALGIFDTGASAVTFGAQDQEVFAGIDAGPIPIKVVGGAAAGGIGGEITGDVSEPGTIYSDGMHAFNLTFDDFGFPLFDITLSASALETPDIQAFVGTESSPLLPTITGTPALNPSPKYPTGAAAHIDMQGAQIDFSDIFPGLIIPFPDLYFASPGTNLAYDPANTDLYEPVTFPLVPFGGDNHTNPGDLITESLLWLVPGITSQTNTVTSLPGNFLFDTGAQLSVISTDMADSLGLDLSKPDTSIDVQGVAGTETVPGFTLKSLTVPRADGGVVEYTDVPIYVLDVAPGIDGIIGMNLLNTAKEFMFDPLHPDGAQLSVSYFNNPDRSGGIDIGGELAALLGGSLGILSGSIGGTSLPRFDVPQNSSTPIQTTTTVVVPTTPVEYGASFSISTSVAGTTGTAIPTGQVALKDGTNPAFATLTLDATGAASWTSSGSPWTVGSHSISAAYGGDANFAQSNANASFDIVKAGTTLDLNPSATQATIGNSIQINGKLASNTSATTAGKSVRILLDGLDAGTATIATDGSYTAQVTPKTVGNHTIQTVFDGSTEFKTSSSGSQTINIVPATSNLTLNLPQTVEYGATFSISTSVAGATGSPVPTGEVALKDGTNPAFATLILDATGAASWTSSGSPWTVGSHAIKAEYNGDAIYAESAANASIEIVKAGTTLDLNSSASQTTIGNSVQISGTLASNTSATTAGKSVRILLDGLDAGTATIAADGSYTAQVTPTTVGSHTIQTVFDGSTEFKTSSSGSQTINIVPATSNLTLNVPRTAVFGQQISLVAQVDSALAAYFDKAVVSFYDGSKLLGRSTMSNASAAFSVPAGQVGKVMRFRAVLSATATSTGATSRIISTSVKKASTSIKWSITTKPNQQFEWRIQVMPVAPGAGTPTGSVRITIGGQRPRPRNITLRNGVAIYKFSGSINKPTKINYAGNGNFESSNAAIS